MDTQTKDIVTTESPNQRINLSTMTIHREGYRYIIIATVLWAALGYLTWYFLYAWPWIMYPLNFICFLLWAWVIWFFRMPVRTFSMGAQSQQAGFLRWRPVFVHF